MFRKIFGRKKSTEEMIAVVFPKKDQEYARNFYASWKGRKHLLVDLGDGEFDSLSRESFFKSATFYFFAKPNDSGSYGIIGADMEDPLGTIGVRKDDGKIVYIYDGTETTLENNLETFIASLRESGWRGP